MKKFLSMLGAVLIFGTLSMALNGCPTEEEHDHDHGDDDDSAMDNM